MTDKIEVHHILPQQLRSLLAERVTHTLFQRLAAHLEQLKANNPTAFGAWTAEDLYNAQYDRLALANVEGPTAGAAAELWAGEQKAIQALREIYRFTPEFAGYDFRATQLSQGGSFADWAASRKPVFDAGGRLSRSNNLAVRMQAEISPVVPRVAVAPVKLARTVAAGSARKARAWRRVRGNPDRTIVVANGSTLARR